MVSAKLKSAFVVEVTGLDLEVASKSTWRAALDAMGLSLQERISQSFADEMVAGSSQLRTNTPEWNQYKADHGLDSRRGHASGTLQRSLDGARLFVVSGIRNAKATITFLEARLYGRVFYAEYYEAAKVRRDGILTMARSWITKDVAVVREVEAQAKMKKSRAVARAKGRRRGFRRRRG